MASANLGLKVSVDTMSELHDALRDMAQRYYDATGVVVSSIDINWSQMTISGTGRVAAGVEIRTSKP